MADVRRPPDFTATEAELFEAISHPVRIKILQILNQKPMGFAELGRAVGIESGGHLSFHLDKLGNLIKVTPEGKYALTGNGKEALWSVNALQKTTPETPARAGEPSIRHRSWLKPVLGLILIVVIILGGLGAYQQREFSTLQQQMTAQQGMIRALEGGVPFTNGQPASTVIGQKDFASNEQTSSQSGLNNPSQVLFDSSGDLWVVDTYNSRVLEFKPPFTSGMKASVVIGAGGSTTVGSGPVRSDTLSFPGGAAFDSSGDIWVSDSGDNRVLEYKPPFASGMGASLVIGQWNFTTSSLATYPSRNVLNNPLRLVFGSSGSLWVGDSGNGRVLEYDPPFSDGMNASLVLGQPNFTSDSPSVLFGLNCGCDSVQGIAIDSSNDVWIGNPANDRILEFKPPFSNGMGASFVLNQQNLVANVTSFPGHGYVTMSQQYNLGMTLAFDSSGNLWTSYDNRMLAYRPPFDPGIRTFPSVEIGQPNLTATAWLGGQSGLFNPGEPAFDSHGNLWVPDTYNNRVLEFVANASPQGSSTAGQAFQDPTQFELVAVAVAMIAPAGALTAVSLRRRSRGRLPNKSSPA